MTAFGMGDGQTVPLATIVQGPLIQNLTLCKEGVYKIVRHLYYIANFLRDAGSGWVTIQAFLLSGRLKKAPQSGAGESERTTHLVDPAVNIRAPRWPRRRKHTFMFALFIK
jgi:hypothetical protein